MARVVVAAAAGSAAAAIDDDLVAEDVERAVAQQVNVGDPDLFHRAAQ